MEEKCKNGGRTEDIGGKVKEECKSGGRTKEIGGNVEEKCKSGGRTGETWRKSVKVEEERRK